MGARVGLRASGASAPHAAPARRVLAVFPRYAKSFGTFDHAFPLVRVKAFMPPQGLLTIVAALPDAWDVRFVDENVRPVRKADLAWADVVLLTAMHVQRPRVHELVALAHAHGRLTVLGGPSVSATPEAYPDVDVLHLGELGDATDRLLQRLDRSVERPAEQEVYRTVERTPLEEFPTPAYEHVDPKDYLLASVQFSSGCPFQCEFCDIPALYGRRPRLKTVEQVTAELDAVLARGNPGTFYFVDDNFIGNPHAAVELLHGLVAWQKERGYPVSFACEATMNLAQRRDILELMREASFVEVFQGIESPDLDALAQMKKRQNLRTPLLDSVRTLNSYGLEVVGGIIMGLDSDDERTGRRVLDFVEASQMPMLTINLLHALPGTALWDRLQAEGRLLTDPGERESNVEFLRPYDKVVATWRDTVVQAFAPEALYRRFAYQIENVYPHRVERPARKPSRAELRRGLTVLGSVAWHVGVRSSYRRLFWRTAVPLVRAGKIPKLVHLATVSHHLTTFAQEVAAGTAEKCFYNPAAAGTGAPGAAVPAAGPAPVSLGMPRVGEPAAS